MKLSLALPRAETGEFVFDENCPRGGPPLYASLLLVGGRMRFLEAARENGRRMCNVSPVAGAGRSRMRANKLLCRISGNP